MSEPTVSDHLRAGMQNVLSNTLSEVAEKAVDRALAKRDAAAHQPVRAPAGAAAPTGTSATNNSNYTINEALGVSLAAVNRLMCDRNVLVEAINSLAAELAELRRRPTMRYCGVWRAEETYSVGDFVTRQGSLWHCWEHNMGVCPGSGNNAWQLAVQHGRDIRDKRR
jgi:hypothetical protein